MHWILHYPYIISLEPFKLKFDAKYLGMYTLPYFRCTHHLILDIK